MAVLRIREAPDPILRQICEPVDDFDVGLRRLAEDLLETMYAASGRGLAAPQVGVAQRMFVMDATWKEGTPSPITFVNPRVVETSEEVAMLQEGCLSIPDQLIDVTRPARVTLAWQDLDGQAQQSAFVGFSAACVQHEVDHLNGVLITDRRP